MVSPSMDLGIGVNILIFVYLKLFFAAIMNPYGKEFIQIFHNLEGTGRNKLGNNKFAKVLTHLSISE